MPTPWRAAVRQALPDTVLYAIRASRLGLRDLRHRVRWPVTEGRGPGLGIGVFDGRPVAYRLRTADNHVLGHSFNHDIFFAAVPDLVLPDDATVLDVGAHIGTFSLLASERAPRGRVYAIEASAESARLLAVNVRLNRRHNVEVSHLALAGTDGTVDLHHDLAGNWGHSITKPLSGLSERVPAVTLTRFLDERGIATVDFAKFNCEGAEFQSCWRRRARSCAASSAPSSCITRTWPVRLRRR
jgi:FkbM family methyltransferase